MLAQSASVSSMCSEREGEGGEDGLTPREPALAEFKDVLFSLIHLCRVGSAASSAAMSPKDGPAFSRSQSIVSDDYSGVPPEEPEWLAKMVASRVYNRARSGRSRPGSRRDSGLAGTGGSMVGLRAPGLIVPSPLRNSFSVLTLATEEAASAGSGAPSPRTFDKAHQAMFERFGSCEGLSAAVDDFYHRLCRDARIGETVKEVPEQDVRYMMMQLMALSMQQQHGEEAGANHSQDRQLWIRHCQSLLSQAGASREMTADETTAVYDAVMSHMMASLEQLGVSAADMEAREEGSWALHRGGGGDGSMEGSDPVRLEQLPQAAAAPAAAVAASR